MACARLLALAALVVIGAEPRAAWSQNPASLGWSNLSMFDSAPAPQYGPMSQVTPANEVARNVAPLPSVAAGPASPYAPRAASEVFDPAPLAPGCATCNAPPPCLPNCCAPVWSPIALLEATFFWPQLRNGYTCTGTGTSGTTGPADQTLMQSDYPFIAGPRLTLGAQGPRWGVISTLWYASNWTSGFSPTNAADNSNGFLATDAFQAYTADLALQRRWAGQRWNLWGFGGVQYGSVSIAHRETLNQFVNNDYLLSATAYAAQRFNGTGITFGGYGTRAIGNSPAWLFFGNQYSILWGTSHNDAQVATSVASTTQPTMIDAAGVSAGRVNDLFIAAFQVGTQWERHMVWIPGRAFLRTAFEYQYWNSGCITASAMSQSVVDPLVSTACSSAGPILFNMIGFNVGAGIIY